MKNAGSFAALGGLVYSTDGGKHCPDCSQPVEQCSCQAADEVLGDGNVRVKRESKGRGGKTVTVIAGLPQTAAQLKDTAKQLKQLCGVGGAVKEAVIEIQGDQLSKVMHWLSAQGYSVKQSGG